ncbi:MAG TPA: Calx-beta domain-containing protein [Desulfatiglandales bacterium]|nr:Calx-beta domain-containing protein [Desulfatiglandales bacterium]
MSRKTKRINLSFWTILFLAGAFTFSGIASSYAANLIVAVPETAMEGDGDLATAGTVWISTTLAWDLVVDLSSDDTSEVTVPATVTIPAGQSSVTFDVTIIDDAVIDGTQTVTITVSVAGWTPGSDTIAVLDNDEVTVSPSIAGGGAHTLALKDDDTLWAWGYNYYGQLGDGTTTDRTTPVQVSNITDVVAIAGGYYHTLALKADGTLWAWGANWYGQLGDGTTTHRTTPVQVLNLTNVIATAGGGEHTLALKADGTLWAWGCNGYGQLGNGTTTHRTTPAQVPSLTDVVAITAGAYHILALKADGTLWAWGYNYYGQLGDGTTTDRTTPVQVSGPGGVGFLDLISLSVVLPQDATEGDGVLEGQGAVSSEDVATSDLLVNLASGDTSEVTAPASVTIPAGHTSASFDVTIVDDTLLDGSQTVSITASATGYYSATGTIQVHDNETATLTVDIPASATEGDGVLLAQGTANVSAPVDTDVAVLLTSNDTSEVTVPATVTIPTGQSSSTFDMTIIDDTVIDGIQTATITASVAGWTSGSNTIDVEDNELRLLAVTVPENAGERDGVLADAGTVSIPGTLTWDLVVDLSSDNTSEVTVPATVTIPTGQSSSTFDMTIIDDTVIDGTQTVTITVSVAGWTPGIDTIEVEDNDPGELQFSSSSYTVEESCESVAITVIRTSSSSGAISVDYVTSDGSAAAGADYTATSGILFFGDGETEKAFSIPILDDTQVEGDETVSLSLTNPGGGTSLGTPITAVLTIVDNEYPTLPYSQDFSGGMPSHGWQYYSSNSYGRIRVIGGRLRMDVSGGGDYALNEAILNLDMTGFQNVELSFFQAEFDSESNSLPEVFTGHTLGDGVAVSIDGTTWYRILNASDLDVGSLGQTFTVDLDAKVAYIQANYDASFGYTSAFKIKFQQYGHLGYTIDYREWDNVLVLPKNSPPFVPNNPNPVDTAVNVPLANGSCTLSWAGGDPDPWDTVVYDVYFGTAAGSLTKVANGISTPSYQKGSLNDGGTYFWQIIARDVEGLEMGGPIWQFTTWASDLVVAGITWEPATNIEGGQEVTFTGTIQNNGAGPAVDDFQVDFRIDGSSIGTKTVTQILAPGESIQVIQTWTAQVGDHTIEVVVDSTGQVTESDEGNNSLAQSLPEAIDTIPPELVGTNPAQGAVLQQVQQIVITLVDRYGGTVDDTAVAGGITVKDGTNQTVSGTVTELNDEFTFTPDTSPMADDTYQVSFTAQDMAGNTQAYSFSFTVDSQSPAKPTITGGTVFSGVIQARPAENKADSPTITLTGTREDNTGVWINAVLRVPPGTGGWSVDLTLPQGNNSLEIYLEDGAGNRSPSEWVDILVDSIAPAITSITPAHGSFLNVAPATVLVGYQEETSGLNLDASTLSIKDSGMVEVGGTWTIPGASELVFTPASPFLDSHYTLTVQLEDNLSNRGSAAECHFTVDTIAPPPPELNPVESPTHNPNQTVSGTKEAYARILLNGAEVVGHTPETTWQHTVALNSGPNQLTFAAQDRALNQSTDVTVEIVFDDIPPLPVDTLTANGEGNGTTVTLDWTGYDESVHGDIASYRIYYATSSFTDVSGLTVHATVNAGTFTYPVQNLTKGTTYWFAVVAVDLMGNANTTVTPVSAVPTDRLPPEEVTNLQVECFDTRLVFTWEHSANTHGDLAGYKAYFNNATQGVILPSSQNTHEETGLSLATAYPFRITAYDTDGNESSGVLITGITLLDNPANIAVTPQSGYVDLTWDGVTPSQYVKHYAVYVSETDFSTVQGMSARVTATQTSAKVAGLTNNVTYYCAVTTVNLSDGERKTVTTIPVTPVPDTQGPEITNVQVNGVALVNGHTLNKPATFTLNAADPAGVSRVEFSFDGTLVRADYNGTPYYDCYWNIVEVDDGTHLLAIVAYDTLGNTTTLEYTLTVVLALPLAPTITQPQSGIITNQASITVSGYAEKYTEIILSNNGTQTGDPVAVDGLGNFTISLTLTEGDNQIQAAARNRAGTGPLSQAVLITLDTTIPASPTNLTALSKASGVIKLTWRAPLNTSVKGYHLYRATASFTSLGEAQRVNNDLITAISFNDLPAEDGTYFYRVTTVSTVDNESEPSEEASALSDRTMPRATSIVYVPQGNHDPETGRMAPGTVAVSLTVSEPLQAIPFFSITPEGGVPFSVELTQSSDMEYSGFFVISDSTPTGTAYAVFSGRDLVGNRGTEIDSGGTIQIDTQGPSISSITIQPPEPIQNDETSPVAVTVTIGFTEEIKPGEVPQLSYLLSAPGRTAITIENLNQVTPQSGDAQAWQATFTLPADAGLAESETFHFIFHGVDDLDNTSEKILCHNLFQVYQGDLPPLAPPEGLTGVSLPGGKIRLSWNQVEGAVGYQLFRKAPGEGELTAYERLETVLEYLDEPPTDGVYTYAVASIRQENEQEAMSGMSDTIDVSSDATSPGAPQDLTLELVPQGIMATWQAPPYTEPIAYSLYRADLPEITSVEGLTPLATGISQTTVIDPTPSPTDHCYVVTAVDEAGNESAPSNSLYLNFDLLPVSSLHVVQQDNDSPVVSWTHPGGSIAGYDIYLGPDESRVKLNDILLTALSYTDTGYAGDERRYTVIAVDEYAQESLPRSITLPLVRATLAEGARIKRGIVNRLHYQAENLGPTLVNDIRLRVKVEGRDHVSEPYSLEPYALSLMPVIIGGYADLPDVASLTTTIEIIPNQGERVEIVRSSQIEVGQGMLVLQILNEEFTRGGTGSVRFTLENTGGEEIEIITARNSGSSPSDEVVYYLVDENDNVLSTQPFKQSLGQGIVTLANGTTVARIPPPQAGSSTGSTFTSEPIDIPVPLSAPDEVVIQLAISTLYFHLGREDQVTMDGLSTTHELTLMDTSYYGEILTITPESSTGDQDIVITGRAVERATEMPLPEVPLTLVISTGGFDRASEVLTDSNGAFSHTFTPLPGESGIYTVRAMHPDLLDRPVQGQFVISRVKITPAKINLSIPTNYEKTVSIGVQTGEGTEVNNLTLVYEGPDQPGGVYPEGVHLTLGSPVSFLGSGQSTTLDFTIWADNTAAETGSLVIKVISDETGDDTWGSVLVNTHFSEAQPVLFFSPDHLETGVAYNDTVTETIRLENRGLADLNDVSLALLLPDTTPALTWVYLNASSDLGTIPVGDTREVSISFSPTPAQVDEGVHPFKLRVTSANYPTTDINLFVSVTQSGVGNALFKVTDIYTGTLDENNEPVQGLADAKITVQNEQVLTVEETRTTDSVGEASFEELPAGRYKCRVTAPNHQEYIGRLWIKPGIIATKEIFLDYNLVTVEWEVTEITIEDRYEIVLHVTYETDVPAAVVVAEPASVSLPPMKAGDIFNGEFTLTNHGLIRAENMSFTLPEDDQFFTYELLGGLPESIEAKERITVPYRVTCLTSPDQGDGSGGGCERYVKCVQVAYKYVCINGKWVASTASHCFTYDNGECTSTTTGGPGGGGIWHIGGGPGGGGTVSSPAPAPKKIDGVICFPDPKTFLKQMLFEKIINPLKRLKDSLKNIIQKVGCFVNTLSREFNDYAVNLSVKVPGGTISVQRLFYDNHWNWEHKRHNLLVPEHSQVMRIESISKGGVAYKRSSTSPPVFTHDTFKIIPEDSGYRWEDKWGNWKHYDSNGYMASYGTRRGVIGKLLYEDAGGKRLIGITDRNDRQVIWYEYDLFGQICAVRDIDNRRVEYTYTDGRLTRVTDALGNETIYEYDGEGRIIKTIDAAGRETDISYDSYGSVSAVVDSEGNGHFFQFDYDEGKKESYAQIRTSSGMIKEIWYDKDGETRRVDVNGRTVLKIVKDGRDLIITDEKGNVTHKEYDEWDNLTRVMYPDGSEVSFDYDLRFNRVRRVTDLRGNLHEYHYDDQGNLAQKTEAIGTDAERVTTYAYDQFGQLLTATIEGDATTVAVTTTFTYDENGNLASITDPEGNTTQFLQYDTMGNLLSMQDPRGNTWTFAYDSMGRMVSQTDPLNNTTSFEYDGANNRTAIINAYLKRFEFEYDDHNNLIKGIDPYQKYVSTEYNTDDLLTRITDQEGKDSFFGYDNEGRLLKSTDGAGNEISYHYDESQDTKVSSYEPVQIDYPTYTRKLAYNRLQRLIRAQDILDGSTTHTRSYTYDAAGNVISETDEEENTTYYEYHALNRLVKRTDPLGGVTEWSYDDRGNLIELKDPNNGITFYEYDRNNRLTKVTKPLQQETIYEYDAVGNRITVLDTKGQKISYEYNAINRLTKVRYYAAGDHDNPVKTVDFTYDKLGNVSTYNDGITSGTYTYDDLQRKISETVNYGPFSKSIAYTYYGNGLKKTFTGPDGVTISYTYDGNNRISDIAIPGQGQITYNTYQWNSPTRITLPGGSSTDYTYDPLMRMKSILAKDPGQNPLVTRQYTFSPVGNITNKDTEHGIYAYQYDDLYRLTQATNPTSDDEAYTYDALDNRLTSAATTGMWSYNANNELEGYGNVTFQYDLNGNTTNRTNGTSQTNYVYDVEDRLVRVEDGQGALIAEYYYDPFGRRLWKEVAGIRTYFFYADEGLIGEYNAGGNEIRAYGYAPDSTWSTNPLFLKVDSVYYWYQNDHLATPQKLVASNGLVVWAATYDSFGNTRIDIEGITNNLRFAGQYFDSETGLHYNLNRYYDPKIGRYLRTDPFGDGLNLYAYCFNNPLYYIDPMGLCAVNAVGRGIESAWEWWSDLVVVDEIIPEHGESWESYSARFREAYSAEIAISEALSILGVRSAITTGIFSLGISGAEKITSKIAERTLTTFGWKGFMYQKGWPLTMRLRQASSAFARASRISWYVTVGATAYRFGLYLKPRIIYYICTY